MISSIQQSINQPQHNTTNIRIFTKCDTFDSDEAQERTTQRVRSLYESDENQLSPHAVVCRLKGKTYIAEAELEQLQTMRLPDTRSGVAALRARLPPLFAELICTNLPVLERNIQETLQATRAKLTEVGAEPPSRGGMIRECQRVLERFSTRGLEEPVSKCLIEFKDSVVGTEKKLKKGERLASAGVRAV